MPAATSSPPANARTLGSSSSGVTDVEYRVTTQTTPTRHKERVGYDRAATHAVFDEAVLCHVGFVIDGRPVVLPQLHARVGDALYLHGSSGARAMRAADPAGLPVCVTVTLMDALVLARSAFNHSINYRSVVVHGTAVQVTDKADKQAALAALFDAVAPGRSAQVRGPSGKELAATTVLRLPLHEVSLKTRTGPPSDEPADLELPCWAGLLPLTPGAGTPQPAPDLPSTIDIRPMSPPGPGRPARRTEPVGTGDAHHHRSTWRTADRPSVYDRSEDRRGVRRLLPAARRRGHAQRWLPAHPDQPRARRAGARTRVLRRRAARHADRQPYSADQIG